MALQEEFEKQGNWLFKYRGILPLIILAAGIIVYVNTILNPENFLFNGSPTDTGYEIICLLVSFIGLFIRAYTVGHTPANTSGRNTTEGQIAEKLNTTGIYSIVRHPLYLGNFFMWLGVGLLTGNIWFIICFCLVYWLYYERIMFAEEQFLRGKFGAEYIEWSSKTPAFCPNFKLFTKPSLPFSWKKVLKKEKSTLLSLALTFCALDLIGTYVNKEAAHNYVILGLGALSIIGYAVLKLMSKKTDRLDEAGR